MKFSDDNILPVWDSAWFSIRNSVHQSVMEVHNSVMDSVNNEDYKAARISMRGLHRSSLHMAINDSIRGKDETQ